MQNVELAFAFSIILKTPVALVIWLSSRCDGSNLTMGVNSKLKPIDNTVASGFKANMTIAKEYLANELQLSRPQPMYDRAINRIYRDIFYKNPIENAVLIEEFKNEFLRWLDADKFNKFSGFKSDYYLDTCIGCTQFIDDLYQTVGRQNLMIFANDYTYHWRLNNDIIYSSIETLTPGKELLIAMPFPFYGDVHPQMNTILDRCLALKIPVHIDGAWVGCVRGVEFDFSHPAISSFAISLSKALGLGANRIALRFTRERKPGPISIMNDFNMNCQGLLHIGIHFMRALEINFFWNKYADAYDKICKDFDLQPTKAIHIALLNGNPVGLRPLLRLLNDR